MPFNNLVTPSISDYDNLWDASIDTGFWTSSGSVTEQRGGLKITGSGGNTTNSITSIKDLRGYNRVCVSIGLGVEASATVSAGGTSSATSTAKVRIWDGGSNTQDLMKLVATASNTNTAGTSDAGAGGGGGCFLTLTNEGGKIRVRICEADQGNSVTGVAGTSASYTATVLADNTLVDTSAWTTVQIEISANISGQANNGDGRVAAILSGFEIAQQPLGSKGTAQ